MFGRTRRQLDRIEAMLAPQTSTISLITSAAGLEREIGIPGVMDFINTPPAVFAVPPHEGRGISYSEEHFSRMQSVPGFAGLLRDVSSRATPDTSPVLFVARWPHWHKDWKASGLKFSDGPSPDEVIVLMADYDTRDGLRPRSYNLHNLRGTFDYGDEDGVFVTAVPTALLAELFPMKPGYNYSHPLPANGAHIAPEHIIGLTEAPTDRELQLIEQVLRTYWKRLAEEFGYRAHREDLGPLGRVLFADRKLGQDPAVDELPEVLELPTKVAGAGLPREVDFKNHYGARGFLESWHRLARVARMVRTYQPQTAAVPTEATA